MTNEREEQRLWILDYLKQNAAFVYSSMAFGDYYVFGFKT